MSHRFYFRQQKLLLYKRLHNWQKRTETKKLKTDFQIFFMGEKAKI